MEKRVDLEARVKKLAPYYHLAYVFGGKLVVLVLSIMNFTMILPLLAARNSRVFEFKAKVLSRRKVNVKRFILIFIYSLNLLAIDPEIAKDYQRYFFDTYKSLELMRDKNTGLVKDATSVENATIHDPTSPTNIGLDLMVQMEALKYPELKETAQKNIKKTLSTMVSLDFHQESGLFLNRYTTDKKQVTENSVSTVDNINLAMSLWVMSQSAPDIESKIMAKKMFERMDFSFLYDEKTGLFYGGAYVKDGQWKIEEWKYNDFGSEARSLYGMGYAIGIIKDKNFMQKSVANLKAEMNGPMLKLWDGGAFQLLLPRLFVNEEKYSKKLKESFLAYSKFILKEGEKNGYKTPAAFSASQACEGYNGKSGSPDLVSSRNDDLRHHNHREKWDAVFTPHAAILAAASIPEEFIYALKSAETLGHNGPLYRPGLGWLDGHTLKGKNEGMVVPVFLSLNQGMIALSLSQILAEDGMTVANRTSYQNDEVRKKLEEFYREVDEKILIKKN